MTKKYKDISPKQIYDYFNDRYFNENETVKEEHYFIDKCDLKECKVFLKTLRDLDIECLNRRERTEKQSILSELTIKLWESMLKQALDALDVADDHIHYDTIKGISRLKKYLVKFKEFELLLYGSDKWYRDTIYHQLWFYFILEYLFSDPDLNIMDQLLKEKTAWYCDPSLEKEKKNNKDNNTKIKEARYAFFCVIALCHDLGKPLEKIQSINNSIRDMLGEYKFLHFNPFKVEFPLTYGPMLHFVLERLGQIGFPDRNDNKQLVVKKIDDYHYVKMKNYMMNQPHLQASYSTNLAELNHGMISCLLLIESFRRFKGGPSYQNWKKSDGESDNKKTWIQKSYLTAQSILKPIANHSSESIELTEIDIPYFWIYLVDDLAEGYRPTRAGKDFITNSICTAKIKVKSLQNIGVLYEFSPIGKNKIDEIRKDVIHFFIDKLERYFFMLNVNDFHFSIKVRLEKDIFMEFTYNKNPKFYKVGRTDSKKLSREIKSLLMLEKDKRIEEIKNIFNENFLTN